MIKITDKFYINANSNCYTLQEKTTVQDANSKNYGQEIMKDLGYYTSIEGAIKGFLKAKIREFVGKEEENSLKNLITEIEKQNEFLQKLKLDV